MTETDYKIKRLPDLLNILGLNATKEGEDRRKRKDFWQQPKGSIKTCKNEDSVESEKQIFNDINENDDGIDYCA